MPQVTRPAIAVVGCGHWGPNHVRVFSADSGADVIWAIRQNAEGQLPWATEYPDLRVTTRLDDALNDARVTAIVVATPAASHAAIARSALLAGKHVLCEKPLATTSADCRMLVELARSRGLVLMNGLVYLFNPWIREIKRLVESGAIGTPRYATAVRANAGPVRQDVGAAWDLASHDIAIFNYLFDAIPATVSATGRDLLGHGLSDVTHITLTYPDGITVGVMATWLHPHKVRQFSLVGDQGMVSFDELASSPVTLHRTDHSVRSQESPIEPLKAQARAFLQAIASGDAGCASGTHGWDVVRTLEAVSSSVCLQGAPIAVARRPETARA
jgi:predicted dehydrogenase